MCTTTYTEPFAPQQMALIYVLRIAGMILEQVSMQNHKILRV